MIYTSVRRTEQFAYLLEADGSETAYPWVFLKDNDPQEFHETAGERTFDLLGIELGIQPEKVELTEHGLCIKWSDQETTSQYSCDWLMEHAPGHQHPDQADFPPRLWDRQELGQVSIFSADACQSGTAGLLHMLHALKSDGVVLIDSLSGADAGLEFGRRIGATRSTNFGDHFSVHTKPNANNLAYTSRSLPLHTDLPNQLYPPDFQFLHCISNSVAGGESQLVDGWKVAEDMRTEEPELFTLLSSISIPFRFCDDDADILARRPCIELDERGRLVQLSFSGHLAAPFDMPPGIMIDYYRAFRDLMERVRRPHYQIDLKLDAGQMMVMNNRRVLHGRNGFTTDTGERQLLGFYIDKAELDSRYRKLRAAYPDAIDPGTERIN